MNEDRVLFQIGGRIDDVAGRQVAHAIRAALAALRGHQLLEVDLAGMRSWTVAGLNRLTECAGVSDNVRFRYG